MLDIDDSDAEGFKKLWCVAFFTPAEGWQEKQFSSPSRAATFALGQGFLMRPTRCFERYYPLKFEAN